MREKLQKWRKGRKTVLRMFITLALGINVIKLRNYVLRLFSLYFHKMEYGKRIWNTKNETSDVRKMKH